MDQSVAWRNGSLVAVSPLTPAGAQELLQFATQAFYAGFEPSQVVPSSIWVPPADSQTFATLETNIGDYVEQWADQFVDGAKSLSTDWNSYLHGLNGLRLAQYTALTKQSMGAPLSTASYVSDAAGVKYLKSLVSLSDATALQLFNAAYTQVRG